MCLEKVQIKDREKENTTASQDLRRPSTLRCSPPSSLQVGKRSSSKERSQTH